MSTEEKKKAFIAALGEAGGSVTDACKAIGISRNAYYKWRKRDSVFAGQCDDIIRLFSEAEAHASESSRRKREQGQEQRADDTALPSPEDIFERYKGRPAKNIRADLEKRLRAAMESAGTYKPEYGQTIRAAATQGTLMAMSFAEIDRLAFTQVEFTSSGAAKVGCNPAYAEVSRLTEKYLKSLRALGLHHDPKTERNEDSLGTFLDSINRDTDD